jgi:hypothetical protein
MPLEEGLDIVKQEIFQTTLKIDLKLSTFGEEPGFERPLLLT